MWEMHIIWRHQNEHGYRHPGFCGVIPQISQPSPRRAAQALRPPRGSKFVYILHGHTVQGYEYFILVCISLDCEGRGK